MSYLLLFPAGVVAGALNVIAGGGSFLSLPILIFLGLPASIANGTNRVAILFQNIGAAWSFHNYKILDWRWALGAAVPATLGAGLGTAAAVVVGDEAFKKILAFVMVAVTLWTLLSPLSFGHRREGSRPDMTGWSNVLMFFAVGVYGGFVQAGVGFLVLAVTTVVGLDLVQGNALKVFCIMAFTVLSLSIFAWQGMVDWPMGLTLAAGNTVGGLVGTRLTVLKGHGWVRAVVTVTVVVFAIRIAFW